MPRKPRLDAEDGIHHVFAHAVARRMLFEDAEDVREYTNLLGMVVEWKEWRCLAYWLMRNHVHLLVETPAGTLGPGMQVLHGRYGRHYNDRQDIRGAVFDGRFGSKRMQDVAQMWATVRYIARNPVEAKVVTAPERYAWSSHAATLGLAEAPPWLDIARLLEHFAGAGGDPLGRYAEHVATV